MKQALIGVCAILIAVFPGKLSGANEDVAQMLTDFYKWYVPHLDKKPGTSTHKMSDFVTERLLARIEKLSQPEAEGEVAKLDWDPFLNAQDYDADWGTKVQVSDVKAKGDTATATVRVGGKEGSTVRLALVRSGDRWRIDNFIPKL